MSQDAERIAALEAELARVRAENSQMRQAIIAGRHAAASCLRALDLEHAHAPTTDRFHNGG